MKRNSIEGGLLLALTVGLALTVVAGGLTGVVGATESSSGTLSAAENSSTESVDWTAEATAGSQSLRDVEITRGDIDTIEIDGLNNRQKGTLRVGSRDAKYEATIEFEDRNRDGTVTLELNSYIAGGHTGASERSAWSATGEDAVTSARLQTQALTDPIGPGEYEMNLTTGSSNLGLGTLTVTEAELDGVTAGTAPGDQFGDSLSAAAVSDTRTVAEDDVIVATVRGKSVFGPLEAQSGSQPTTEFRNLVNSDRASLTLQERPRQDQAEEISLDVQQAFDDRAIRVVSDRDNATLYVMLNESDLRFTGERRRAEPGDRFAMNFTLERSSDLFQSGRTVSDRVRLTERPSRSRLTTRGTSRPGQSRMRPSTERRLSRRGRTFPSSSGSVTDTDSPVIRP